MTDHFDVGESNVADAEKHFENMGKAIIQPRHRSGLSQNYAAQLSASGTIDYHDWHDEFNGQMNAFLSATRSIPDVIRNRFGYDRPDKNSWPSALDPQEQDPHKADGSRSWWSAC